MGLRVFVEVSDNYLWALRPFAHLFNVHWSELQPVVVFGYSNPTFPLPPNFSFFSIDAHNYPAERWSDGFITFLQRQQDEHFVLLLVDYWLCRMVDHRAIASLHDYMRGHPRVLRMDLTADRLYAGGMRDADYWGSLDIIETGVGVPYQLSLQAAIWNRKLMLELLVPGKSPWEVELHTSVPDTMRVLGTRQYPIRYATGVSKGKVDREQLKLIQNPHLDYIMAMIPPGMEFTK
jgi:hypothetical protein